MPEPALFGYDAAVTERYPTIRAGVVHATGLDNQPSPADLLAAYAAGQRTARDRLEATPIAELAPIAAWRRAFTRFGAKPTQHRNAAEALLRRLARSGDLPPVNTLVDIGNLVSIRHALPVAVFDLTGAAPPLTVRVATGSERFTDLGAVDAVSPEPGEVVFVDRGGVVCARRWCWRQSAQSATRPTTSETLVVVEGHHHTAAADVATAVANLVALLTTYQPGSRTMSYELSPTTPATTRRGP